MLQKAKERGFAPEYVLILKLVASFGWFFLDEAEKQSFGESRRGRESALRRGEWCIFGALGLSECFGRSQMTWG